MNQKKVNGNTISHVPFDLNNMTEAEIKAMFMSVSIKSLASWLEYYKGREAYEICTLIKEIKDYRSGGPARPERE